jgi:hypothetical protein
LAGQTLERYLLKMKKITIIQLVILVTATVNAWLNFPNELPLFMAGISCYENCDSFVAILMSPSFWNASLVTLATILSLLILRKEISSRSGD